MSNKISLDAVSEILSNLPVKDLLHFKTVSKQWHSLINEPYLAKLHLRQSVHANRNNNIILSDAYSGKLYFLKFDSVHLLNLTVIDHPSLHDPDGDFIHILGSYNGLLCLSNLRKILLWNISTGDSRVLPEYRFGNEFKCTYGFGYDSINDDYKVVKVEQEMNPNNEILTSEVKVYSLKENKWRRTGDQQIPYRILNHYHHGNMSSAYVNGAVHWVAIKELLEWDSIDIIIAWDVQTEKHHQIELLDDMQRHKTDHPIVASLHGCLCACLNNSHSFTTDVWMMKDYGMKESWCILYRFQELEWNYFRKLTPRAYSEDGDALLLVEKVGSGTSLCWYDLKERKFSHIDSHHSPLKNIRDFDAEVCMESLVQLGY